MVLCVKQSTCSNLLECLHDWYVNIQSRNCTNVVHFDFKKAFDFASHPKLLSKLKAYELTGNLLAWITDFLSNRSQCVRLGNSLSQPISVLSGVPQRSVIGPTLFLLFVNDVQSISLITLLFRSSYMLMILNYILVIILHHPVMIYLLLSIDYMIGVLPGS